MFENKSLSTKSATPSWRVLESANAIPTVLFLTLLEDPGTDGVEEILIAMTIGADRISLSMNKRSSTAERLPGDAYSRRRQHDTHVSELSERNIAAV